MTAASEMEAREQRQLHSGDTEQDVVDMDDDDDEGERDNEQQVWFWLCLKFVNFYVF